MKFKNILIVFLGLFSSGAFAGGGDVGSVVIHVQKEARELSSQDVLVVTSSLEIEGPSSHEKREELTRGDCSKKPCVKYSVLAGLYVFFGSVFFGTLALHATGFI